MLSTENVNKFETPSNKQNTIPKSKTVQNQKHLQIFCKDLSKINIPDECGWTPLYRTIIAGDIFASTLLLNNGADPNIQCTMGETPLYQAVDMEKIDHVKLLLKNDANPNITNDDGLTPLHIAVMKQNITIVKILLKYGADPNLKSKLYEQTPLHLAIKNNADPMILLLLVQFNGSLINEDKFRKKPIDYTNSKEMQNTIEKLKFDQEKTPKVVKDVQKFQTPKRDYKWTPSNVYTNTIRSQSHKKDLIIEGSNAVLQNPGNLKYTIINGKNNVSNKTNSNKVVETVKKDLFNSSEGIKISQNNSNVNIENLDSNNLDHKDLNKKIEIMKFLEDKENICPNNVINFSLKHSKTGKFGEIQEENSLIESRQNNSIKQKIIKKNTSESNSSEKDKINQIKEINFSFSTNTFNNNKMKTSLSQSLKPEDDDNKENISHNSNNAINNEYHSNDNSSIQENININEENINYSCNYNNKERPNENININTTNKKKIVIKKYYNKEEKKGNIKDKNNSKSENNNNDYLYEKIIKKSITKIEIYDENENINNSDIDIKNENITQLIKTNLTEDNSKTRVINKSLYNKPIIKNKFNLKKVNNNANMRPSIEINLNKSRSSLLDNSFPKRSTFSGHIKNFLNKNSSFHQKKLPTAGEINPENIKNIKIKNLKTNTLSGASLTTLGFSGNELNQNQNQNQNSLWKFLNDIITNEKSLYQSFLTNNINSDIDNDYEMNFKYPIYEWLKEINLHCYYSLFKEKRILSMDKVISNLKTGKFNITKNDIQKIGILIPGHIYRIITKLEIDSGKINEKISNYILRNKKRMIGNNINIVNNSYKYCCGCCSTKEQMNNYNKTKRIFSLEQWLIKINMIKYRENFYENGFDLIEYFILQMFSTYPIDDYIVREELNIKNDKDRDIILLRLNKDIKYIILKTDDNILCYNNSYEIGEQRNFEDNNLYEFDIQKDEKTSDCLII